MTSRASLPPRCSSRRAGSDGDRGPLGLGAEQIATEGPAVAPAPARQDATQQRELLLGSPSNGNGLIVTAPSPAGSNR